MAYEEVVYMGLTQEERERRSIEFTSRAVAEVYPKPEDLAAELSGERRLTAYMGIDPTAPDIHIGHGSQLLKLGEIQKLGHRVILLIGDFTGMIGDPTDRSAGRVRQTREEVLANAEGYKQQAGKLLDFDHPTNPIELKYNSEWLGAMSFADVLELAANFTVQQMLVRDMFDRRMSEGKPLNLTELLYPLMQGWDSVSMVPGGVDIEVGGSDQIFNMLVGSELIGRYNGKQKYVVAGRLLTDPTGKKIGKTEGNMITLNDTPLVIVEKVMRFGDAIVPHALELCTATPMSEIADIRTAMENGDLGGIEAKELLAKRIVETINGEGSADQAIQQYRSLSSKHSAAEIDRTAITSTELIPGTTLVDVLVQSGLATSKTAARRLITDGAVRLNDTKIDDSFVIDTTHHNSVLQVGKRIAKNFRNIVIKEAEA